MELMARGHYRVARRYIIYRAEHAKMRAIRGESEAPAARPAIHLLQRDRTRVVFDPHRISKRIAQAARGLEAAVSVDELTDDVIRSVFDGISVPEVYRAQILAARSRIERDPAYDVVAARLMLNVIYQEALGETPDAKSLEALHRDRFEHYVIDGIRAGRLSPVLREFDLARLARAMQPGATPSSNTSACRRSTTATCCMSTIGGSKRRSISGCAWPWAWRLANPSAKERAIEFYEALSSFRYTSATPTLFNSGTVHPQLSSCFLSTVQDDLGHIFKVVSDNARLSKWAGGLGNDWTSVRATNAHIQGTNGKSQGVIPFLKVVNDAAIAVNQGGKRKGAVCCYLETWHLDIDEFLDLRKNTGDDRRRTHDMHTANWIPDLFMKRVRQNGKWTLFSPNETADLHDLYGKAFEERYEQYERMAEEGDLAQYQEVSAVELWRKMLTRLFETGHPWLTFKDPSNIRSPQDHVGVVHCSNLCTEILLNTSADETAVCNLGSINLAAHVVEGRLDETLLKATVATAMRMLDNVIDVNFYPTAETRNANRRHRPVGLGLMGFQDALYALAISFASEQAVEFADRSMELISYYAIQASAELARERGAYESYPGSKWSRGILPIDSLKLLEEERGETIAVAKSSTLDWQPVRDAVAQFGMRNSNVMAIAPTATISTIIGVSQSIEPAFKHLYAKSNLSGEFTQVNGTLVDDLKRLGLWDAQLLDELKHFDGSVQNIGRIPLEIRQRYLTAFEIEPKWLIECAAQRQKWIDQGQSLNLYLPDPSGRKLNDMYMLAWQKGLKTTYYLRTLAATQVEKSTLDVNRFGIQPKWMKNKSASSDLEIRREPTAATATPACKLDDPDCEVCQ